MIGHEWAEKMLREHIAGQQVRHAYLFSGAPGSGRRTLALRFAQALNCPTPTAPGEPCRTCRTCQQIERMQQSDLTLIQAEEEGGHLKVDQIRSALHMLSLAPYESRYRIALLLRFQEANANAQNALLKTLEEPASRVILLLTADTPESLLPTIVSRCEVLRLHPLPIDQESRVLQNTYQVPAEQARLLAHLSAGRLGTALRYHQNPELLTERAAWVEDVFRLLGSNRRERFHYVEQLNKKESRNSFRKVMQTWLIFWRDLFLSANGADVPLVNLDNEEKIKLLAGQIDPQDARVRLADLEKAVHWLDTTSMNARLIAENLLLDWPRLV